MKVKLVTEKKQFFKCNACHNRELHWQKITNQPYNTSCLNKNCSTKEPENSSTIVLVEGEEKDRYLTMLCQVCQEKARKEFIDVSPDDLAPADPCPPGGDKVYFDWYCSKVKTPAVLRLLEAKAAEKEQSGNGGK